MLVAAATWAFIVVPDAVRRREFRAAEKQAARLQKTIKQLSETAESDAKEQLVAQARDALAREKMLIEQQKQRAAERSAKIALAKAEREAAELRAKQAEKLRIAHKRATLKLARLQSVGARRARAAVALLALAGVLTAIVGVGFAIAGQGALVFLVGAGAFGAGLFTLITLAPGRVRVPKLAAEATEQPLAEDKTVAEKAAAAEQAEAALRETEAAQQRLIEQQLAAEQEKLTAERAEAVAKHREAQALAAQRSALAQAQARSRARARAIAEHPAASRENQTSSILLRAETREEKSAFAADETVTAPVQIVAAAEKPAKPGFVPVIVGETEPAAAENSAAKELAARLRDLGVEDLQRGKVDLDAALRRRRNG